ncbi:transmembrane protein 252-like [Centropristis striata]|uniref:transmembrane protein 252-like n=1 Tax=Centropristis striata TaxID=184440 RepID=UPI0027E10761|nr:transmembrane protein 252-like [Centropristis striata]
MMMDMKKQLWSLARLFLPAVGLAMTCIGAYLVSWQNKYTLSVIPTYVMIIFGILAVLIGFFWTMCHSMKTKVYHRRRGERHIQVYTIDRPSSFPPSYEESQGSQECPDTASEFVVTVDEVDGALSLAPPLYSQDSSDAPDCTYSWEQPPRYSQVERTEQGEVHAEERREAMSTH